MLNPPVVSECSAYASPWKRMLAYLLDFGILMFVLVGVQLVVYSFTHGFPYSQLKTGAQIELWVWLSISLPAWLYFTISEHSSRQATLGKLLLHLRVTPLSGERLGWSRGLLRTALKLLPWELTHMTLLVPLPLWWDPSPGYRPGLIIVYLLIGMYLGLLFLTPRRQTLHDLLVGTVVKEAA